MAKKSNKKQDIVVQKLDLTATRRNIVDIGTWRDAHRAADRDRRISLYDLYEEALLDNILDDAIDKRISAVTNAELTFTQGDSPVDEMDTMIDTIEFEKILTYIVEAKFHGISLIELEFSEDKIIPHLIPRKHVRAKRKEIAKHQNDETGIPYDDDFFLEIGEPNDLGLILKSIPYVIYKRNNFGDWAQYVEVFGMPIRTAYYDLHDETARQELKRTFEMAGGILTNILPKGSEFKVEPGSSGGTGAVYDLLRKSCNEEILIGILGQTMTTLDGSSRSQGEVHWDVQKSKHKADLRFVQRVLNSKLLPMLEKRGYPVKGGYFYFPEAGENLSLKDRIAIDMEVAKLVPVGAQHIYDTYGVPRPEEGEELISDPAVPKPPEIELESRDEQDKDDNTMNLLNRFKSLFLYAPLEGALNHAHPTKSWASEVDDLYDNLDNRLLKRVVKGESPYFDAELFNEFSTEFLAFVSHKTLNIKDFSVVNLGFTYGVQSSAITTAMETNLFHFSAAKTLAEIQELNQIYRESNSFAEFHKRATELCGRYNKIWARTEYEAASRIANGIATYHRHMGMANIFTHWQYRTSGDDKVRASHMALHELILPANDPAWKKIYPPNDWGCRCRVEALFKGETESVDFDAERVKVDVFLESKDWAKAEANGFGTNKAEQNVVFEDNQMYIRKFPNNAAKYLDRLTYRNYGLEPYTKLLKDATEEMPLYEGDAKEWYKKRELNDRAVLETHQGRSVVMTRETFRSHTTKKHIARVKLLEALPQALKNPDEVWLNATRGKQVYDNYNIIKYYQNEILVVCCRLEGGELYQIKTWYPLAKKGAAIDNVRRGLLIYKKKTSKD